MKKSVITSIILSGAAALSAPAVIASEHSPKEDGKYLMAGTGITSESNGFQLTGGLQIAEYWFIESTLHINSNDDSYNKTFDSGYTQTYKVDSDTYSISIAPVFMYPMTKNVSFYGKGGMYYGKSKTKVDVRESFKSGNYEFDNHLITVESKLNKTGFTYGLGIQYSSSKPIISDAKLKTRIGADWYSIGNVHGIDFGTESVIGVQVGLGI